MLGKIDHVLFYSYILYSTTLFSFDFWEDVNTSSEFQDFDCEGGSWSFRIQ